jgi:hypothetical protein
MRIIFYSNLVEFCVKLIEYIKTNKLEQYFKIVNIDDLNDKQTKELGLSVVPTLIDSEFDIHFEGVKAWEYVKNQKYFNHPTNNIEFTKEGVPKPVIEEDNKANVARSGSGFIYVDDDVAKKFVERDDKNNFDKVFNGQKQQPQANNQQQSQPNNQQNRGSVQNNQPVDKRVEALRRLRR